MCRMASCLGQAVDPLNPAWVSKLMLRCLDCARLGVGGRRFRHVRNIQLQFGVPCWTMSESQLRIPFPRDHLFTSLVITDAHVRLAISCTADLSSKRVQKCVQVEG